MKKRWLSRMLCICMAVFLLAGTAAGSTFPDVADDAEYAEAVEVLNSMGIMQGDSKGNFNPNSNVTRAQMAAIICRVSGGTEDFTANETQFSDVPADYWASAAIAKAASMGIINGYEDGTFRPNNTVSYAQALTMVVRTASLEEDALSSGGYPNGYIEVAQSRGLSGRFTAGPNDLMTRWQIASIILGLYAS